jgi:protein-L-isoaspartate(D-aspartate) O-methyltransferase
MEFKTLQKSLAAHASASYKNDSPLSITVINAFMEVPRHQFVNKFRNFGDDTWYEFNEINSPQLLPGIYQDNPIVIWGTDEEFGSKKGQKQISTISQPSFVLRMLDLLDLKEGQSVFELGTASGWNAALISHIVGPTGKVVTVEIISELAEQAVQRFKRLDIKNVKVISGDGAAGDATSTFDRVMYTAGAFDFPAALFEQTKVGGLVIFILKNKGGSDNLYVLKKHQDFFESTYSQSCGFVPVTGSTHFKEMEEKDLNEFLSAYKISAAPTDERTFWWGSGYKSNFVRQTAQMRGFLSLSENFQAFQLTDPTDCKDAFGWYDAASNSLALATAGKLVSYGNAQAREILLQKLKSWIDLGMPSLDNMRLRIYRSDRKVESLPESWTSRRPQSTFVWSLPSR